MCRYPGRLPDPQNSNEIATYDVKIGATGQLIPTPHGKRDVNLTHLRKSPSGLRFTFCMKLNSFCLLLLVSALPIAAMAQTPIQDVENPARFPLRFVGGLTIHAGNISDTAHFYLPANKRYVVEYVNVKCTPFAGNPAPLPALVEVQLLTRDSSAAIIGNPLVPVSIIPGKNAAGNYILAQNIRLYADHGPAGLADIEVTAFAENFVPGQHSYDCGVVLSGYTIDLPQIRIP